MKRYFAPLALIACALPTCSESRKSEAKSPPRLVLLLVVDALRPDHLGCYGSQQPTSPAIDAFAKLGTRFEHAYAASSWTKPSVPSILTGLAPTRHGVLEGSAELPDGSLVSDVLSDDAFTLAECLKAAGYQTGAFLKNAQLAANSGFGQGFDVYLEGVGDAAAIQDRFFRWLDETESPSSNAPRFAYLHFLDVHWPYLPPKSAEAILPRLPSQLDLTVEGQGRLRDAVNDGVMQLSEADRAAVIRLYDACIRGYDEQFARFRAELERRGLFDDSLIVLTSDHGEEFGEAGKLGHGHSLSENLVRVPLVIKGDGFAANAVRSDLVSHLDLLPTLARRCGGTVKSELPGSDLSSDRRDPRAVSELLHGVTLERSIRAPRHKLTSSHTYIGELTKLDAANPLASLKPGMRVEAKGKFESTEELEIDHVGFENSSDDDVEVRGPIRTIDVAKGIVHIGSFELAIDPKIHVAIKDGNPTTLDALKIGDVIDVDGEATAPYRIAVKKIELRPDKAGSRSFKLEALVDKVDPEDREITLARVTLELEKDAEFVGFDGPIQVTTTRLSRDLLRSDLSADTGRWRSQSVLRLVALGQSDHGLAPTTDPDAQAGLARQLVDLLSRGPALMTKETALDDATKDELRQTGYLR